MFDVYFAGREMTSPFTSGKYMADYTLEELRQMTAEVTEDEKRDPFYRYYSEKMADLEPEHEQTLAGEPLKPEQCFMPDTAGGILLASGREPESCKTPDGITAAKNAARFSENGWGVMENGIGFARVLIHQTGITDEMIRIYRKYFCHTENRLLFYKLWHPHHHMIHFEDGIVENWGWGFCRQDMNPEIFSFQGIGISKEEIPVKDPDCIGFLGIGGRCVQLDAPERPDWPMVMIQHTRLTEEGRELRVLYYNGLSIHKDGTIAMEPSDDRARTMHEMKCMYSHCAHEYTNELKLMKRFFEDYKNGTAPV